jgi:hypothetical protein
MRDLGVPIEALSLEPAVLEVCRLQLPLRSTGFEVCQQTRRQCLRQRHKRAYPLEIDLHVEHP